MALALVPTFAAPAVAHSGSFPAEGHMLAWYNHFKGQGHTDAASLCAGALYGMYHYTNATYGPDMANAVLSPYSQHGYILNCPGIGAHPDGPAHGVTCFSALCPEGNGPYVSVRGPAGVGSTAMDGADGHNKFWATYYVLAHETGHAYYDIYAPQYRANECVADDFAVIFGAHDHFGRCT